MTDFSMIELELCETVGISRRPTAVTFRSKPPQGVPKFAGKVPSGCSFFRIASGGMTFYTIPADHYNCPLGCYSYNLPLAPEHSEELAKSMESIKKASSVKIEEIRSIPRTEDQPEVDLLSAGGYAGWSGCCCCRREAPAGYVSSGGRTQIACRASGSAFRPSDLYVSSCRIEGNGRD
jgi:hypothetical protein